MSSTWIAALERLEDASPALRELGERFGEYSRQLLTGDVFGYEPAFYLHVGDLEIDDGVGAFAELCELAERDGLHAVLVVDGDLRSPRARIKPTRPP